MSAKNNDAKGRWRNVTVAFRVSPEENEEINMSKTKWISDKAGIYCSIITLYQNKSCGKSANDA
mgnify:CR=1 FL=1